MGKPWSDEVDEIDGTGGESLNSNVLKKSTDFCPSTEVTFDRSKESKRPSFL